MQTVALLLAAAIALLAVSTWLARATGRPEATLWFVVGLAATLLLGVFDIDAMVWVDAVKPYLLTVLLPLIVFETSYCVDLRGQRHLLPAAFLAAGGLVVTTWGMVELFQAIGTQAHTVPVLTAVIAALVILPTDATPLAPLLRLKAPRGLRMLLRNELPFAAALTTAAYCIAIAQPDSATPGWPLLATFLAQLSIGAVTGAVIACWRPCRCGCWPAAY
ncbi:MAG: hypothetical protein HC809_16335 [Gammaproteobacteria bacterium]|nr:hypothetical protein [Gammaproteobacteria bacterium]